MAEREWDSSSYRQPLDGSGSAMYVGSKVIMTPQTEETSSLSLSEGETDKTRSLQRRLETSVQPRGRRDDSTTVKTKSLGVFPSWPWDTSRSSTTVGQTAPFEQSGFGKQSISISSLSQFEFMESSSQGNIQQQESMETAISKSEVQGQNQAFRGPPSDSAESREQFGAGVMSLVKAPSQDWTLTPYQLALWEQTHIAESAVTESQESMSLLRVSHKTSHEDSSQPQLDVSELDPSQACEDDTCVDYPDMVMVDGAALNGLTKDQLVAQCFLRSKLMEVVEVHEREMVDELNRQDNQNKSTEEDSSRLREKVLRLEEENRQLRSRQTETESVGTGTERMTLKENTTWGASAILQVMTILYSSQLRDFAILRMIDHGYEGATFLVQRLHHVSELFKQQLFALRVVFNVDGPSAFTEVRDVYQNEYQTLCTMVLHQNVIQLYAFFYDRLSHDISDRFHELPPIASENARKVSLFLVLEYIPTTLEQAAADVRKAGKLTVKQVMQWTLGILTGVEHLLEHHYLHRDLKLNSIRVSDEGIVKLCDFGCSIQVDKDMTSPSSPGGSLRGNSAHMPPELLNAIAGRKIQWGSQDLWACGVLVYEMAAGELPFTGLDQKCYRMSDLPQLVIKNEISGEISVESTRFPAHFSRLILSLLEFDPSKRPSVQEAIKITTELLA